MATSLKNSKYSTNCTCLLVSDCFCALLLLHHLTWDASGVVLMKWVILLFSLRF